MQILLLHDIDDGDLMAGIVINDDEVEYTTNAVRARLPQMSMTWITVETLDDVLEWAEEQ